MVRTSIYRSPGKEDWFNYCLR